METLARNRELLSFIAESTDCYHTVAAVRRQLDALGYRHIAETSLCDFTPNGKYYITRNASSLIAFRIPETSFHGFMITASHGDSPTFKLKPNPELIANGTVRWNTEPYGGLRAETWLDRPLSVSGRVILQTADGITSRLVRFDRDLLVIPSVAPHLIPSAERHAPLNPQTDLLPLLSTNGDASLASLLAEELGCIPSEILDADLFLYPRTPGILWGTDGEFISAPRLDDLQCVFAALQGFLSGNHPNTLPVFCVFDNEEVGSGTKQGAKSTFLADTLARIGESLGASRREFLAHLAASFLLSCDNAHAIHPNHPEKSDPVNAPKLNGGVVLKYNANQKYTTDAVSAGIFRRICQSADVPMQFYTNRSDIAGGSTLGNLATQTVSVNAADIGLAQLAMHSSWETAGTADTGYLISAVRALYQHCIIPDGDTLRLQSES